MGKQTGIQLVWNDDAMEHQELVNQLLRTADRFDCAVAFAKTSGIKLIKERLEDRLEDGMKARFIIGLSLYVTHPDALERVLRLKEKHKIQAYIYEPGKLTFHPKIYQFKTDDGLRVLVGSANLTEGGLKKNYESSVLFDWPSESKTPFDQLLTELKKDNLEELTEPKLAEYRAAYEIYAKSRKAADQQAGKQVEREQAKIGLSALRQALKELRSMKTGGFMDQVKKRYRTYKEAHAVLHEIAYKRNLSGGGFLRLYEELVGSKEVDQLWHSAGLSRGKTTIAKHVGVYQRMLRKILEAPDPNTVMADVFDLASEIPRAGLNAISEVLHTVDRTRFAVMNHNSTTALRLAGFKSLPDKPTKTNTGAKEYLAFCGEAKKVQKLLGLTNLTQLDVVCNHYYQTAE